MFSYHVKPKLAHSFTNLENKRILLSMLEHDYLETLKARGKTSRIYRKFQDIGLQLADILRDAKHKALYIKLAQQYDESILLSIAKDVAERKNVTNRGAYFMKVLHERYPLPPAPTKKQRKTTQPHDSNAQRNKKNSHHPKQGGRGVSTKTTS